MTAAKKHAPNKPVAKPAVVAPSVPRSAQITVAITCIGGILFNPIYLRALRFTHRE